MNVEEIVRRRGIKEVMHFTTHRGLMGALHSGAVKSRKRLPSEVDLRFIYAPNAIYRKDPGWLDYVNLSISRINSDFFAVSCRWHRAEDLWWCIMAFDPVILGHPGVYFATTNNMYTGVMRGPGTDGLERLFNDQVVRWSGNIVRRRSSLTDEFTTCVQAEVLYPGELSIRYLRRVYVVQGEDQDEVYAQMHVVGIQGVDVAIDRQKFA